MPTIYGIDLGTTFTKCAVVRTDGVTQVFDLDADPSAPDGPPATPILSSVVAVTVDPKSGRKLAFVGSRAWSQFRNWNEDRDPPFKRFEESKLWVGENPERQTGDPPPWDFPEHEWSYRAEDIGALVLRKVKLVVEAHGAEPMRQVVVTHPQNFTEVRREATRQAAFISGLDVVDTITEPDAAAIAYGRAVERGLYMVFDLGGGTLDITLANVRDGRPEVITSEGLRKGGRDWDREIFSLMLESYSDATSGEFRPELLYDRDSQAWLREAEAAKRFLTDDPSPADVYKTIRLLCPTGFDGPNSSLKLSRSEFERKTQPLVDACEQCADQALQNARKSWADLRGVLLVGGATRLRKVRQMLEARLGRPFSASIDPNTAVAQGAAIHAHALSQRQASVRAPSGRGDAPAPKSSAKVDVYQGALAHGLGVLAWNGKAKKDVVQMLIPKDSPIPMSKAQRFTTNEATATSLPIELYEGDSTDPEDCERLGVCNLTDLPPGPAGQPVDVRIDVAANGAKSITVVAAGKEKTELIQFDEKRVMQRDALADRRSFIESLDIR